LDTDRAERIAVIGDVSVLKVHLPDQEEKTAKGLGDLLEREVPKWQMVISLDQLLASLEMIEQRTETARQISTDPPRILFVFEPAVLITIDGEPKLTKEEGSELMRVINTPFTILFDSSAKTYYLFADKKTWYTAAELNGDWRVVKNVPPEVAARAPKPDPDAEKKKKGKGKKDTGPPPKIIVATEPTELISTNGEPKFKSIAGTALLYMSNTDSDVLQYIKDKQYYVLLAGRWYASAKTEGPWHYVSGEKLPTDFSKIPEDSEMGTVLYAVPGTNVANEAVMDTYIPQTGAVDREKATLKVEYDGEPKFEAIAETQMAYAVNTATPVIRAKQKYYACDEAVWFAADQAVGPWRVATQIPGEIYTIPPDSPVYHVTFVRIYNATDDVVYVGYTPGYTHTYVYHSTIVYGTGFWWPGWHWRWYHPWPATWGFHARFNPWVGWGFGFSFAASPFMFHVGMGGWFRGGWWGPARFRGYRNGFRHGYRRGRNAGYRAGYRSGRQSAARQNMYRSQANRSRTADRSTAAANRTRGASQSRRANNVYADRNGNVHRKTNNGWQNRTKDGWQSERGQASQNRGQRDRYNGNQQQRSREQQNRQLDRSDRARQQGNQRARSYNQSRGGGGRGGGGRGGGGRGGGGRGGGGRRR
jgi:hypothetical protein